jgi:hypothetical protein
MDEMKNKNKFADPHFTPLTIIVDGKEKDPAYVNHCLYYTDPLSHSDMDHSCRPI